MGLLDKLGGIFGTNKTQTQNQNTASSGTQSGTTFNQSNLWPQLQGYFANYGNLSTPGAFNQYQLGAANNQSGVAGGLGTAFNTANFGAQGGLYNPGSYQSFMSPYLNDVAMSTLGVQGLQKAQDISALRGNQAVRGALGNNTGAEAAYFAGRAPYDTQAINQIYQQGFNTANQNAQNAAGLAYQGAGLAGNLTGAATGANQSLFGMGQTLWQDPLNWSTQWNAGLSPFLAGAGQTGTTTGQFSGNQNTQGVTRGNEYNGGNLLAGLGQLGKMGLGLFGFADGGAVKGYASGGGVTSFADKVKAAHDVVKQMQSGGEVARPKFAFGGWEPEITMGSLSPSDADWVKDTAETNQTGYNWGQVGDAFKTMGKTEGGGNAGLGAAPEMRPPDLIGQGFQRLGAMMQPRMAWGGGVQWTGEGDTLAPLDRPRSPVPEWLLRQQSEAQARGTAPSYRPPLAAWDIDALPLPSPETVVLPSRRGEPPSPSPSLPAWSGMTAGPYFAARPSVMDAAPAPRTEEAYRAAPPARAPETASWRSPDDRAALPPRYAPPRTVPQSDIRPMTQFDRAMGVLSNIGGPAGSVGAFITGQNEQRLREIEAQRETDRLYATLTGQTPEGQPTLAAMTAAGKVIDPQTGQWTETASSIAGHKQIKEFELKTQRDLAALEMLQKTEKEVQDALIWGNISPEDAQRRLQSARELYTRMRGNIQDVTSPATRGTVLPPGTTKKLGPGELLPE